jgi:hypothetical protein
MGVVDLATPPDPFAALGAGMRVPGAASGESGPESPQPATTMEATMARHHARRSVRSGMGTCRARAGLRGGSAGATGR